MSKILSKRVLKGFANKRITCSIIHGCFGRLIICMGVTYINFDLITISVNNLKSQHKLITSG